MRVLHITPYFAPAFRYGGPPRSILGLCRALIAEGVDVEVFTTTANGDQPLPASPDGTDYEGIRVRYFPLGWPQRYWRAKGLTAALRISATSADLVHIHGLWNMTSWCGASCSRAGDIPYIVSPRGMLQPEAMRRHRTSKTAAYWAVERRNLGSCALLHATSDVERRQLERYGRPIALIPNGVTSVCATPSSINAFRERASVGPNDDVVAFLGRLHPIKRLDLLADAFAMVHQTNPSAKLVIAGPDEDGYGRRIAPLFAPVSAATRWVGALDAEEIGALFAISRVLVHCSDSESFGMSIAEALAAGVPVVATSRSGWTELQTVGGGYSVEQDVAAIASAVRNVLDDPDPGATRQRAREWARRTFAWDSIARAMCDTYETAIATGARRA